jgi:hypothetical protein
MGLGNAPATFSQTAPSNEHCHWDRYPKYKTWQGEHTDYSPGRLDDQQTLALKDFGPFPAATTFVTPARGLCTSNRANGACQTHPSARLLF